MRRLFIGMLATLAGCQAYHAGVEQHIEAQVAAVAAAQTVPDVVPADGPGPFSTLPEPLGLPGLWNLALANNPALREAAANVEAARGRFIQASKYPNPQVAYSQENLGTPANATGAIRVEVTQEILTAGKRPLDIAISARGLDAATVGFLARKFTVLTNIRLAYYDFLGWTYAVGGNEELVTRLEQGLKITKKLVEEARARPRTDLLQIEGLLAQARLNLTNSRASQAVAWRQLAARVGVPELPMPQSHGDLPERVPSWDADVVLQRVVSSNTSVKQAAVQAEQARLQVERAKAGAIPNVTIGGGFGRNFADPEAETGAIVSVQTALPLWDRKQGIIQEAEANWAKAKAGVRTAVTQLSDDTAAAFGRYVTAREQVEQLTADILPRLQESLGLLRKGYQSGAAGVAFTDVLFAEQALLSSRQTLASARRSLWLAIAELQGLMQLDLDEEWCAPGALCN